MKKEVENKVSLLKDIELAAKTEEKVDERVNVEKNKVMSAAYNILVVLILLVGIINDSFNIVIPSEYLMVFVGVVSYVMLLIFCKKGIIRGNKDSMAVFIWGIITFPISIINVIMNYTTTEEMAENVIGTVLIVVLPIFGFVILPVTLYKIANSLYKKAMKEE